MRRYKYVAVIGLDGMGAFCNNTPTPNLDRIFENGCKTTDALSMAPTISAQNWGAMLLGAKPSVHGITNENISLKRYSNEALPSIFKRVKDVYPDALICSYCNWNPINFGLLEEELDVETYTNHDDNVITDKIVESVKRKPDFLFVQLDNIDGAGHTHGYGTQGHLDQITLEDSFVGRIYDEYCKQGIIDDTLFCVITDHGGIRNGHGGFADTEKYIFFGMVGKTVIKNSKPAFMQTRDISAIVLYALGIDIPEYDIDGFTSQIPDGIFSDYDKKYFIIEAKPNIPETKPTPEIDGKNGLYQYFDKDKIMLNIDMDNNFEDKTGKHKIRQFGTIKYYSNGVRGSYAELGNTGFAQIDDLKFGNNSFTVAFWVKMNPDLIEATPIVCNKDWWWQERKKNGFCISLRAADIFFNLGCEIGATEIAVNMPENVSEGWVHIAVIIDKDAKEFRAFCNFKPEYVLNLHPLFFEENHIDALPLVIGNDALHKYNNETYKMIHQIDDLLIFNYALDNNDIKKLEAYYSI